MLSLARLELPNTWQAATKEKQREQNNTRVRGSGKTQSRQGSNTPLCMECVNMPKASGWIDKNINFPTKKQRLYKLVFGDFIDYNTFKCLSLKRLSLHITFPALKKDKKLCLINLFACVWQVLSTGFEIVPLSFFRGSFKFLLHSPGIRKLYRLYAV